MRSLLARRPAAPDPLEEPVRRYLLTGDEGALDLVVRETRLRLLAAARRIGDPQDAEDAVQGAYLSLVRRRGEPLDAPVFPWLLTTVVRIAYRRKALVRREEAIARRLALPAPPVSPLAVLVHGDEAERLRRAVDRLPAGYRDPVVLHYLHGLTTPEVGRLLDLPEATVRTRLRRARGLLRSRLPAGFLAGLLFLPWFLRDAVQGAGLTGAPAAMGGLMGAGGTAAVVVAVGALGVLAGAKLFGGAAAPPPGEVEAKVGEAEARLRTEIEGLKAGHGKALKALEAELDEARKRAVEAEAAGAAARKEVEEARAALEASRPAVPAGAEAPAAAKGPRFALGEYEAVLKDLDWRTIGGNMQQMVPLLEALARGIAEGKPLDGEGLGRIQQLNGPLVTAALKIGDRIPGSGINAKFTHPVFSSNAMAFALEAAKLPLTDRQAEALGKLAQEFADRDRARIAGYDERVWALQKVLDEAALREDFFEAAFGILTEAQGAALRPAATRGLLGLDLFSTGLLWQQHLVPVFAPDRAGAGGVVKTQAATWLAIPEEKRAALDPFIAEWVAAVPDSLLAGGGIGMAGVKAADVEALARTQVALMRKIVESQSFGDAVAGKARDIGGVLLPIKQ